MKRILVSLKEENVTMGQSAERDWLTGLYSWKAAEDRINGLLRTKKTGILFLLDVDDFKEINRRYGHMSGDRVLQGIARIMSFMTFRNDILGRVSGDRFVIFMPVSQDPDFVQSRCRQLRQRFLDLSGDQFPVRKLPVTVCGGSYQSGDNYGRLFRRVEQCLQETKKRRKKNLEVVSHENRHNEKDKSIVPDIEHISRELSEPGLTVGAFCQDYNTFVSIYRFVERRLKREQSSVFSLLFTLMDQYGEFPSLKERNGLMDVLQEIIQKSMRSGDVFTRYSSCQYLVMVSDVSAEEADIIAERICLYFRKEQEPEVVFYLTCHRYPLNETETEDRSKCNLK